MNLSYTLANAVDKLNDEPLRTIVGITSNNDPYCITLNEMHGHVLAEGSAYGKDLVTNAIQVMSIKNNITVLSINDENPSAKDVIHTALNTALRRTHQHMVNFDIEFTKYPLIVYLDNPVLDCEDIDRLDQLISLIGTSVHVMLSSKNELQWPEHFSLYEFDNYFKLNDQLTMVNNQDIRIIPAVK